MTNASLIEKVALGDPRSIARAITLVENEGEGYDSLLQNLQLKPTPIVGITGPPGAGKSTLISALLSHWVQQNKKIGIIAVDPSSPFHHGALMGDRLRMNEHYLQPNVFIRSMASRGNLGGLSPKVFEACDVMRAANFDYIIIETVGVGQSEVEIAALADTTILVLVPEAGDEIQTIKSGVMEIADIYVLNKADREGADAFLKNLMTLVHEQATADWETAVVKTVAAKGQGIAELVDAIIAHQSAAHLQEKRLKLLADKALMLIRNLRTKLVSEAVLMEEIRKQHLDENFNLYRFVQWYEDQTSTNNKA